MTVQFTEVSFRGFVRHRHATNPLSRASKRAILNVEPMVVYNFCYTDSLLRKQKSTTKRLEPQTDNEYSTYESSDRRNAPPAVQQTLHDLCTFRGVGYFRELRLSRLLAASAPDGDAPIAKVAS